jgi:hypothetical protein
MADDEGASITFPFNVIFTVITSPDVDGANMYGHMQRGIVEKGNSTSVRYWRPKQVIKPVSKVKIAKNGPPSIL